MAHFGKNGKDLDEMLLEAATGSGSPSSSRGSYSDDGSDSRDDDLDDAEHSSSNEDDDDDDDDDTYDDTEYDSFGNDLYKGDKDRKRLEKMSELDREMILAEREEKRNDKALRNSIKKQKEKSIQTRKVNPSGWAARSSARSADRVSEKNIALKKLGDRKRLREQDPEPCRKRRDADSAVKRKGFTEKAGKKKLQEKKITIKRPLNVSCFDENVKLTFDSMQCYFDFKVLQMGEWGMDEEDKLLLQMRKAQIRKKMRSSGL